eukprot:Gregarina_sp_Poly_1__1687@NODE_1432_length_4160_cov_258_183728_g950_i0_p3_GENE_NODE_1432_length_4160_cov_258_183728_g950_i0NODE_1432_length_4160_cov_258_183728_g950_i0_p3_ORF_typecomplete_len222_score30_71Fra10Ac1/PF09725_9/8_5e02Fra10Ac1/PF09725_9/5_3e40ATS/PF15445_6/0_054_NODE_1432_length_4160_cov_258_183728_g950_i034944138
MFKKDIISGSALNYCSKRKRDEALGVNALYQSQFDSSSLPHQEYKDPLAHTKLAKHRKLIESVKNKQETAFEDDFELLKKNLKFLYEDDGEDETDLSTSGARLALAYYKRLHKEYVLVDLSRYEAGQVGMRWRTEGELIRGKGQFECGSLSCSRWHNLESYELHFQYKEDGTAKEALVKARLCSKCVAKLHKAKERRSEGGHSPTKRSRRQEKN